MRCDGRCDSGRRADRRGEGRAALGCYSALARHRDPRRRHHQTNRAEHHDSNEEEPNILNRRGQPNERRDKCPAGRARICEGQHFAGAVPPDEHSASAAGRPTNRGHLRHRRQRHLKCHRRGQGHGKAAGDHNHRLDQTLAERD